MQLTIDLEVAADPPRVSNIFIGTALMGGLPDAMESLLDGRKAFWVWDRRVHDIWYRRVLAMGWPDTVSGGTGLVFAAGEAQKRLAAVEALAEELVDRGADRGCALVAVGGGVTGDVTGFLASIYMRGVPCFQVPTTLLAQVDSSVGGKTGVDLARGKNLLGTFHQPRAVWIDPNFLESLPEEEFRQGMAEVIKTAMIGDDALWGLLEADGDALRNREPGRLVTVVSSCVRLKARIVSLDAKESGGLRRVLNLGHTVGHAVEKLSGYEIRHGDAVAMGLAAAATLAVRRGRLDPAVLDRLLALCRSWGLPVKIPSELAPQDLVAAMAADKKQIGGKLHFILPEAIGRVAEETGVSRAELLEVLESLKEN